MQNLTQAYRFFQTETIKSLQETVIFCKLWVKKHLEIHLATHSWCS